MDAWVEDKRDFLWKFKNIWADNGDAISLSYTGTGATTSLTTRHGKGGITALMDHKMKSISRFYMSNFEDAYKEKSLMILTGPGVLESNYTVTENSLVEANEVIMEQQVQEFRKKQELFTTNSNVKISVFTWHSNLDKSSINET